MVTWIDCVLWQCYIQHLMTWPVKELDYLLDRQQEKPNTVECVIQLWSCSLMLCHVLLCVHTRCDVYWNVPAVHVYMSLCMFSPTVFVFYWRLM